MEYKQKYLKYKQKYIDLQKKNLLGGSYIIASHGETTKKDLIVYPEVSILLDDYLGSGGSGSVQLGIIIDCSKDARLIGKKVAIKTFKGDKLFTIQQKKDYEKNKMLKFSLDENGVLKQTDYVASLYFDIITGPLEHRLVYEYGGKTLCNYVKESPLVYNNSNNKRIMYQLFSVLHALIAKDNMQNDIKCENIVYSVNPQNEVDIKLIDFGASMSITALNDRTDNFGRRTNMNTPETIYNHLLYNTNPLTKQWALLQTPTLNKFNKWDYYPFISMIYFLYSKQQYSPDYIFSIIPSQKSKEDAKLEAFKILINNDNIKMAIDTIPNINETQKLQFLKLIDMMCKPLPDERAEPDIIIDFLHKWNPN